MSFTNYDKCGLLLPMSGSNNDTKFTDWIATPNTVTTNGGAKTSTTQSKYYGSSGYFDGTSDSLSVANSTNLTFGTGDFTIAFWLYASASGQVESYPRIMAKGEYNTAGAWNVVLTKSTGGLYFEHYTTTVSRSLGTLTDNTWTHIAITRSSGTMYGFKNGVQAFSVADSKNFNSSTGLVIGAETTAGTSDYTGYLQDVLLVKGAALWTADFTPEKLIGSISGIIKDDTNANAVRAVTALPRSNPSRTFHTTSASDGTYTVTVPNTECNVIVLDNDAGTLYNDLVMRVMPG